VNSCLVKYEILRISPVMLCKRYSPFWGLIYHANHTVSGVGVLVFWKCMVWDRNGSTYTWGGVLDQIKWRCTGGLYPKKTLTIGSIGMFWFDSV
jgi:hypothetical protein